MLGDQEKLRTIFTEKLSTVGIRLDYERNGSFEMYECRNSKILKNFEEFEKFKTLKRFEKNLKN